jgi:hypothetical protein
MYRFLLYFLNSSIKYSWIHHEITCKQNLIEKKRGNLHPNTFTWPLTFLGWYWCGLNYMYYTNFHFWWNYAVLKVFMKVFINQLANQNIYRNVEPYNVCFLSTLLTKCLSNLCHSHIYYPLKKNWMDVVI